MKTPEEIKNGLDACGVLDGDCEDCPYDDGPQLVCVDRLRKDAIAYIQQIEARLAQVERERDAAVMDIETAINSKAGIGCHLCKHNGVYDCIECVWEWRGVCPENTKEADSDGKAESTPDL